MSMSLFMLFLLFWGFVQCVQTDSPNAGLNGLHFKASASNTPPSLQITKEVDGNFSYSGIIKEICDWMFNENSNSSYEFVNVDPKDTAKLGFTPAAIKLLLDNKVDIVTIGLIPSVDLARKLEFTPAIAILPYQFLLQKPGEESRLIGPIRPFQDAVWILFIVTALVFVLALSGATKWRNYVSAERGIREKGFAEHFSDNFVYVITIIIGNGEYIPGRTLGLRILVAVWCLMCVILINAYTGNLTSYLTIPTYKPIPNSFEELAARKDLQLLLEDKKQLAEDILNAKSGAFKVLGDSLRRNPEYLFKSQSEGLKLMSLPTTVYPGVTLFTYFVINLDLKANHRCRLTLSKPLQIFQVVSWGLAKNGPHNKAVETKLQYLWETGLMNFWLRKYTPNVDRCLKSDRSRVGNASLKLIDLSSAFVLLVIGLVASILIFAVEYIRNQVASFNARRNGV